MKELVHGGDVYGFKEAYGIEPLDFSANINPLGIPKGVKAAAIDALETCDCYPDPLCRELCLAIASHENVPSEWVLCGNGAADIIFRLAAALRPKNALVLAPTFAEYEHALLTAGCKVHYHILKLQNEFKVEESILKSLTPAVDMLFLCNPNNPTGEVIEPHLMKRILAVCSKNNITVVVDECFNCFLDKPEEYTVKHFLKQYPNLLILKAFTKLYAMAGLRLGYCLSANTGLLGRLALAGQPWSVSTVASAAGIAALKETEYVRTSRELIRLQRNMLINELAVLGFEVFGSHANYIFFRCNADNFAERLKKKGILVRSCGNYHCLDNSYYRIAVRSEAENIKLLAAIRQL